MKPEAETKQDSFNLEGKAKHQQHRVARCPAPEDRGVEGSLLVSFGWDVLYVYVLVSLGQS